MRPFGRQGRHSQDIPWWEADAAEVTPATASKELAEESEAFLSGRLAELLGSTHKPVEAWAWLNQVAHAEPERLQAIVAKAHRPYFNLRLGGLRSRRWRWAVAQVASDLLSLANERPRALRHLQTRALVPLELELARSRDRYTATPETMVVRARAALYRTWSRSRRDIPEVTFVEAFPHGGRHLKRRGSPKVDRDGPYFAAPGKAAAGALVLAGVGVCSLLAFAPRSSSPSPSSLYGYYISKLSTSDQRPMDSRQAFRWVTGGEAAPGWEGGRDLPTFLLPWKSQDPGRYVGWLFAGAPGPKVSWAAARSMADKAPMGARVYASDNRLSFASRQVRLVAVALPHHSFRIAGMSDPTVVVPAGATVHLELVNDDAASAHGLVVVPEGAVSWWTPMAHIAPAFPGASLWFLGDTTRAGSHVANISFRASAPGSYVYLDPVPGSAEAGMAGALLVQGSSS